MTKSFSSPDIPANISLGIQLNSFFLYINVYPLLRNLQLYWELELDAL